MKHHNILISINLFVNPAFGRRGSLFYVGGEVLQVIDSLHGTVIATEVKPAYSFMNRLRGLLFTSSLPRQSGIHIQPCRSVHTYFMQYPIDIIYLDANRIVVGLEHSVAPGKRGSHVPMTYSVLEIAAGRIEELAIEKGQKLHIQPKGEKKT
jgi:uncharacterized membrane protein (UPF0127 family)